MNHKKHTSLSFRGCTFEALESRQLMSAPDDLALLALQNGRHAGTTSLYLNFDGGTVSGDQAGGTKTISAYQPNTPFDRTQAIQDILFRTQQIFSPFDVRVQILRGAGNYATGNGATTIFVGDQPSKVDALGHGYAYASTPFASSDYPGQVKGYTHKPNSDSYDLAFVDPLFFSYTTNTDFVQNDLQIAQAIAHEAGHTFGLAHVLSAPDNDIMSYNSSNVAFLNNAYPITSLNYDGQQTYNEPKTLPIVVDHYNYSFPYGFTPVLKAIPYQTSFAYLRFALGDREVQADSYRTGVADPTAVEPAYYNVWQQPATITTASHPTNTIQNYGEYDVYNLSVPVNRFTSILAPQATRISLGNTTPGFDPQVLLYDATGQTLIASGHGSAIEKQLTPGQSYKLVVSGYLGDSTGTYTVNFASVAPPATLGSVIIAGTATTGGTTTTTTTTVGSTSLFSNTLLASKSETAALLA